MTRQENELTAVPPLLRDRARRALGIRSRFGPRPAADRYGCAKKRRSAQSEPMSSYVSEVTSHDRFLRSANSVRGGHFDRVAPDDIVVVMVAMRPCEGLATLAAVRWVAIGMLAAVGWGCGAQRPPRYVIESDVGGYHYRRYQQVADVELPMAENPAVGHTATYVRGGDQIQVLPVFVTSYERASGLGESVRQQLRAMDEYQLDVKKLGRENVWQLRGESGDVWLLWISGKQLVKIGAPNGEPRVPADVASAYLAVYPSDLNRTGHIKRNASSAGPTEIARGTADPRSDD
jgi:hypothetical protein